MTLQYKLDKESKEILGRELWNKPLELKCYPNNYVIDIGGNTGKFSKQLKTQNNTVVLFDIDKNLLIEGDGNSLESVQGNILYLPFKNNIFDIVLARAILHHVPKQLDMAFKEMERITRPGGIILIEEPGYHNPIALIMRKAFPTTSHEEGEIPLKVNQLKKISPKYFNVLEIKYFWLLSYTIPHLISRLPKKIKPMARQFLKQLVILDNILLKFNIFKPLCGYIMIVAKKE